MVELTRQLLLVRVCVFSRYFSDSPRKQNESNDVIDVCLAIRKSLMKILLLHSIVYKRRQRRR